MSHNDKASSASSVQKTASRLQKMLKRGHGKAQYISGILGDEDGVDKDTMDENLAYFEAACKMLSADGDMVYILSKSIFKGSRKGDNGDNGDNGEDLYIMIIRVVQDIGEGIEGH
jgi:GTPase